MAVKRPDVSLGLTGSFGFAAGSFSAGFSIDSFRGTGVEAPLTEGPREREPDSLPLAATFVTSLVENMRERRSLTEAFSGRGFS